MPNNTFTEKIIALFYIAFGVGFYGMTIGDILTLMKGLDADNVLLE